MSAGSISDRSYRKIINAWAMYDWANSAFATTIMAAVYPIFYRSLVLNAGKGEADATAYWGYTNSISILLIALAGPILGTISDCTGSKKKLTVWFAALGVLGTAFMVFLGENNYVWGAILFTIGTIGFSGSNIFYEALLPHIAKSEDIDRVSTRGYAIGYIGGGLLLCLNVLWIMHPEWFFLPGKDAALRTAFLSVAIWWAVFTIPLMRHVPEPPFVQDAPKANLLQTSFSRLALTVRDILSYKQLLIFLAAFWIYNDGIGTIIKMATAYGDEIGISQNDMILALIITQFVGIPCAFGFGAIAGKIGAKRSIILGLVVYLLITVLGFFMKTATHFYMLAFMVGLVQGGTQALSRSLFATMVPKSQTAEFFGFYSTGSKFAGIIGPTLFGIVGQMFASSRMGILSISIFFIIGGALLLLVNVEEGQRMAAREDAKLVSQPHAEVVDPNSPLKG